MRELLIQTDEMTVSEPQEIRCTYSIIIDEMQAGSFSCESYGVKITDPASGRTASVPHVTTSVPRIDELLALLIRNHVTPTSLRDVIDDWL